LAFALRAAYQLSKFDPIKFVFWQKYPKPLLLHATLRVHCATHQSWRSGTHGKKRRSNTPRSKSPALAALLIGVKVAVGGRFCIWGLENKFVFFFSRAAGKINRVCPCWFSC